MFLQEWMGLLNGAAGMDGVVKWCCRNGCGLLNGAAGMDRGC